MKLQDKPGGQRAKETALNVLSAAHICKADLLAWALCRLRRHTSTPTVAIWIAAEVSAALSCRILGTSCSVNLNLTEAFAWTQMISISTGKSGSWIKWTFVTSSIVIELTDLRTVFKSSFLTEARQGHFDRWLSDVCMDNKLNPGLNAFQSQTCLLQHCDTKSACALVSMRCRKDQMLQHCKISFEFQIMTDACMRVSVPELGQVSHPLV